MKRVLLLVVITLLAPWSTAAMPAAAQTAERCFPETGFCISGLIRQYWERNGGLRVFGYPITTVTSEQVEGRTLQVQWFERDRLEIQPEGYVTAGRLGARLLEYQGRPWESMGRADPVQPTCRFFPQTGRSLCGQFLSYWQNNGGVERFGYPILDEEFELVEGKARLVQYFERRRMELYPELAGTPYEIQLGLLGRIILQLRSQSVCRDPLGTVQFDLNRPLQAVNFRPELLCPGASYAQLDAAVQWFEQGAMVWINFPDQGQKILVVRMGRYTSAQWAWYTDQWKPGDPDPQATPPPGYHTPVKGFGKLWAERGWRDQLGWAIEKETAERVYVQMFGVGGMALFVEGRNQLIAVGPALDHVSWVNR